MFIPLPQNDNSPLQDRHGKMMGERERERAERVAVAPVSCVCVCVRLCVCACVCACVCVFVCVCAKKPMVLTFFSVLIVLLWLLIPLFCSSCCRGFCYFSSRLIFCFNQSFPVFRSRDEYQEASVSCTLSLADRAAVAFVSYVLLIVLLWLMFLMFS